MKSTWITAMGSQFLVWAWTMGLLAGQAGAQQQTYRVSIVDHNDKPLPGIEMLLGESATQHKVRTDPKGRFEIKTSAHSVVPVPVRITSPGWILVNLRDDRRLEAIALPRNPAVEIRLRMERTRILSGRLTNQEGVSVAGAEISVLVAMRYAQDRMRAVDYLPNGSCAHLKSPFKSDLQGRFAIEIPDVAGAYAIQSRRGPRLQSEVLFLDTWSKDPSRPLEIRLFRTGRIEGEVRFHSVVRPRCLTLYLNKRYKSRPSLARDDIEETNYVELDRRDRFAARDLLPGSYRLDLWDESWEYSRRIIKQVDLQVLSGRTTIANLDLFPEKPKRWDIQGVVVDEVGRGIEGLAVTATLVEHPSLKPPSVHPLSENHWTPEPAPASLFRVLSDKQGRVVISANKGDEWILKTACAKPSLSPFLCLPSAKSSVDAGQAGVRLHIRSRLTGVLHGQVHYPKTPTWTAPPDLSCMLRGNGIERNIPPDDDRRGFSLRHILPGR